MKVLVTGHKGFIGSHVYDYFKNALDCEVDGIDLPDDIGDFKGPTGIFASHYDVVISITLISSGRIM